jgi:hypothetical protein
MRFIGTRSSTKEVVKHTNNANSGCEAHKQGQTRFLSTRTVQIRFIGTRSSAKEVVKHTNNAN